MKSKTVFLTISWLCAAQCLCLEAWSQQASGSLRIRGTLIKKNGSPLKNKVVTAYPGNSPQPLDPIFFVAFDQRIDPAAVLKTIQVTAGVAITPMAISLVRTSSSS